MYRIGKLDKKIVVYSISKTRDTTGQEVLTENEFKTLWACVSQPSARERFTSQRELSTRVYRFVTRFASGITPEMTIEYDGERLDITGISSFGERRRRYLEITAEIRGEDSVTG